MLFVAWERRANQALALEEVPLGQAGTAAAVLQTGQRIGSAIGVSAVGAMVFGRLTGTRGDWSSAISLGLLGSVAFVALALLLGLADVVLGRRTDPVRGPSPVSPRGTRG